MTIETSAIARSSDGAVIAEPNNALGGFRKRIFAWLMANCTMRHERTIAPRKRELLGGLTGTIVEIGPGAGANLPYYARGVRWIGIEPNPHMRPYLVRAAREAGLDGELREGYADHLDFAEGSVDAIVSTLVFCSIQNVARSLAEIRRVLKPGGTFVFLEHVAATEDSGTRVLAAADRAFLGILCRWLPSGSRNVERNRSCRLFRCPHRAFSRAAADNRAAHCGRGDQMKRIYC